MAYVAADYTNNKKAPVGQWACAPTSSLGPFTEVPKVEDQPGPNYCGQCVSYVKQVCATLPNTTSWKKGAAVKDNKDIKAGTVVATFNSLDKYGGHAAIYVSQNSSGMTAYDQWITLPGPKAIGPRLIRWLGDVKGVNNGDNYYVVE